MKTQTKLIALVAVAAIAAGATFGILQRPEVPQAQFIALAGDSFTAADLRGRVVLVNFWATSCVTCVAEMPKMAATWRKYAPRGYDMVAVAMSYDHPNAVAAFVRQQALPFRVALDTDGAVARAFGNVSVTPTTYLLDRSGRIVAKYVGEPDWREFHARIERALAEPA
ncbi:MAG: TlpA family protein disulfide reductase [Betaproteobacteria bacterium]|nr:TlpA family protein disulfide reductase [Betaproteobacteria bacterium]